MKTFLSLCIGLMIVSGIYGATDMTRDIKNDELIDYENVRYRHAKNLLFIIKTTGLGTYKFRSYAKESKETEVKETKVEKPKEAKEKSAIQYMEDFGRGCMEC